MIPPDAPRPPAGTEGRADDQVANRILNENTPSGYPAGVTADRWSELVLARQVDRRVDVDTLEAVAKITARFGTCTLCEEVQS